MQKLCNPIQINKCVCVCVCVCVYIYIYKKITVYTIFFKFIYKVPFSQIFSANMIRITLTFL